MDVEEKGKGLELEELGGKEDENKDQENLDKDVNDSGTETEKQEPKDQNSKIGAWKSQLPKELRDKFESEDLPTQVDLAKGYLKLKSELAEMKTASDKDKPKVYTAEDYKELDAKLKEGGADESDLAVIELMKKSNVAPEEIANLLAKNSQRVELARQIHLQNLSTELKAMWGNNYSANKNYYEKATKVMFTDEEVDRIKRDGLHINPVFIDLVAKYGKLCSEGTLPVASFTPRKKTDSEIFFGK